MKQRDRIVIIFGIVLGLAIACVLFVVVVLPSAVALLGETVRISQDRSTHTESSELPEEERVEFVRGYTSLASEPRAVTFLIAYSDSGTKSEDDTWDIRVGALVEPGTPTTGFTLDPTGLGTVQDVDLSTDGTRAVIDGNGTIRVVDPAGTAASVDVTTTLTGPASPHFSPDGSRIAYIDDARAVHLWTVATRADATVLTLPGEWFDPESLDWFSDGNHLAVLDSNGLEILTLGTTLTLTTLDASAFGRNVDVADAANVVAWNQSGIVKVMRCITLP